MDLSKPDGEGEVHITNISINETSTTIDFEGPIEGYGTVFATQVWTYTDSDNSRGAMSGQARVFLEDGAVLASPLAGTFRRESSMVKLFFTDAVNNGDQNFVTWDIDMPGKHAKVRYFSLV